MAEQAGKGSAPRSNYSKRFRNNYGQISWTLGSRIDYENDVKRAQEEYAANGSSKNYEDLIAAKSALRRHFPESGSIN